MHWKQKARIQNTISRLPSPVRDVAYYFVQRKLGGLSDTNPTIHLEAAIEAATHIERQGRAVEGKTFLEIGSGRNLKVPVGLWLCGAGTIITVDLYRYLKVELLNETIAYIRTHGEEIVKLYGVFAERPIFRERMAMLGSAPTELEPLLRFLGMEYHAPADARALKMPDASIDYQVSYTVFEHIPTDILAAILREMNRVLRPDGLLVDLVDFSDHYSHSDESISRINFLQFSDSEWARYGGNRYMYHNRMRVDDCVALFERAGMKVLEVAANIDQRSLDELRGGFQLNEKFRGKDEVTIATRNAWIVAGPGKH
ncbi:MAG: methyltransferase family protein [Chlorobi bacterium]|nr:methyltransferase family protein [Chlorobiota bacterium]